MSSSPRQKNHPEETPPNVLSGGSPLIPTHGSPGVPQSVWLPPTGAVTAPAVTGSLLPVWALGRACAQFAPAGGPAAVLLPPGPGHAERTARPTTDAPGWLSAAAPVELAEVGRARLALALLLADPAPAGPPAALAPADTAAWFLAQIRAALRPEGVLLIHTHPVHTDTALIDPAGALLRAAQTAGLAYLQHLIVVHHRLTLPPAVRARRRAATTRAVHTRVHTDMYVLLDPTGEIA